MLHVKGLLLLTLSTIKVKKHCWAWSPHVFSHLLFYAVLISIIRV